MISSSGMFGRGLLQLKSQRPSGILDSLLFREEYSSDRLAKLASRALDNPSSLLLEEIKSLGGSVLTQVAPHLVTHGLLGVALKRYGGAADILFQAHEKSSDHMATLASRAMKNPESLSLVEIRSLAGSVLTQAPNRI